MLIDAIVSIMDLNGIPTFEKLSEVTGVSLSTIMSYVRDPESIPVSFMILLFKCIPTEKLVMNKVYHMYVDTVLPTD